MKTLRKLGLILSAIAFCLSLSVISANAQQPGRAKYQGNHGKHKGWTKGNHYGWDKHHNKWHQKHDRDNRVGVITPQEQRRLEREHARLSRFGTRINRDGVVTDKEARKLDKRTDKFERKVIKAGRH